MGLVGKKHTATAPVAALFLLVAPAVGCGVVGEQFIDRDPGLPSPAETRHEVRRLLPAVVEQLRATGLTPEPITGRYARCAGRKNDEFGSDQAVAWRYQAHGGLTADPGDAREFPEQLEARLKPLGWATRPTEGVNERRAFDGDVVRLEAQHDLVLMGLYDDRIEIIGPCVPTSKREHKAYSTQGEVDDTPLDATQNSSYHRDPDRSSAKQQRAAALTEVPGVLARLQAADAVPRFAIGEYQECSGAGNEDRWPVDGATWSYDVSGRIDVPPQLADTTFLAEARSGLERLGWRVHGSDADNDTLVRARKGVLTLEISSLRALFISVSGPCASVSQRQHVEYGMGYRDDFLTFS